MADQVAQTQIEVALYALQLLTNANRILDSDKVLAFAKKVWDHTIFVRQYNEGLLERSGVAELAARVAVALGRTMHRLVDGAGQEPGSRPPKPLGTDRSDEIPSEHYGPRRRLH